MSILDTTNWFNWCNRYISPLILNKEYDLAIDEFAPHIYSFPFFNNEFCSQVIKLSEQFDWVLGRHEDYPTTDNLLKVLGLDVVYNRAINEFLQPLIVDRFKLEDECWDKLRDESFIAKYKHDTQSHLSLHHDHSNITALVNLNPKEFEGGGTYFPKYKHLSKPTEPGTMLLHPGDLTHRHGARPVTKGTRYIIVSFIKNQQHI